MAKLTYQMIDLIRKKHEHKQYIYIIIDTIIHINLCITIYHNNLPLLNCKANVIPLPPSPGFPRGFCRLKGVADALELVAWEAEAQVRGNPALELRPVAIVRGVFHGNFMGKKHKW